MTVKQLDTYGRYMVYYDVYKKLSVIGVRYGTAINSFCDKNNIPRPSNIKKEKWTREVVLVEFKHL